MKFEQMINQIVEGDSFELLDSFLTMLVFIFFILLLHVK